MPRGRASICSAGRKRFLRAPCATAIRNLPVQNFCTHLPHFLLPQSGKEKWGARLAVQDARNE
jgi:hypothetical protein